MGRSLRTMIAPELAPAIPETPYHVSTPAYLPDLREGVHWYVLLIVGLVIVAVVCILGYVIWRIINPRPVPGGGPPGGRAPGGGGVGGQIQLPEVPAVTWTLVGHDHPAAPEPL